MIPSLHVADLTSALFSPSGSRVKRWPHLYGKIKSPASVDGKDVNEYLN